jgi:hypothetical protein
MAVCQPYKLAVLYPAGRFLARVNLRAIERLEGLGKLKNKSNNIIGNRTLL